MLLNSPISDKKINIAYLSPHKSSQDDTPLIDEQDLKEAPFKDAENDETLLKGIAKFYKAQGEYFLTGVTAADASKKAHEDNLQMLKE